MSPSIRDNEFDLSLSSAHRIIEKDKIIDRQLFNLIHFIVTIAESCSYRNAPPPEWASAVSAAVGGAGGRGLCLF